MQTIDISKIRLTLFNFSSFDSQTGELPAATDPNAAHILADMQTQHAKRTKVLTIVLWVLGAALFIEPMVFRRGITKEYISTYWALYLGTGLLIYRFYFALAQTVGDALA